MQMHNNYATSILSPKLSITIIEAKEVVSHEWLCMDAGFIQSIPGSMYIYGSCVYIVCFHSSKLRLV